jgi:hypothetical protein
MQQQSVECAHDLCQCTVMQAPREEKFCSQACREAQEGGIETETCGCGHPQCDVP